MGKGLAKSISAGKVKREDVFVTTKLWCTYHSRVEEALEASLKNLGLEYIDLYLMHWPIAMNPTGAYLYRCLDSISSRTDGCWLTGNHPLFPKLPDGSRDLVRERSHIDTYKDMEKLLSTGKVKAIGVCNYSRKYLEDLVPQVSVIPAVNQIENHPLLPQQEIVDYCKEKGIHVTAYSPLGSTGSPLVGAEAIVEVAKKRAVSPGSVLLSWHGEIYPWVFFILEAIC